MEDWLLPVDLSVIIPAKNEAAYLGRCLKALNATVTQWGGKAETILIDNGSFDKTIAIAEAEGCKVIEQKFGTIGSLRNLGAKYAKGNIITFLDADCLVAQNWISYCLENFKNEEIAVIGTRAIPEMEKSTWVQRVFYRLFSGAKRPNYVEWLGTSNLLIKREAFWSVGGFDETLIVGEDVDLCYRIRKRYRILLEKRINTIHLRESRSLFELFKREYWRGQSSLTLFLKNMNFKEIPSVAVPLVNQLAMGAFIILIGFKSNYALIPIILVFSFPLVLMLKKGIKIYSIIDFIKCYTVAFIYIFARSCSIIFNVYNLLYSKNNRL